MAQKFGMEFLMVLLEALGIFLGFDFCPHLIIPVTWNPEYPPPPLNFADIPTIKSQS